MPSWPVGLTQSPLLAGFQMQPQGNVVAFGTEVGPGKVRRRTTARVKRMPFTFHADRLDRDTFISFFEDDLKDGSLSFDFSDPISGVVSTFRIIPSDPPYTVSAIDGQTWLIAMQLQKMP